MKHIIKLIQTDAQKIFRDKTLLFFLLIPIILILVVRYVVPSLGETFEILKDYYDVIVMFGGIQTSIIFGFVISFIILEEKDENVMQVIHILPISAGFFIFYRLVFAVIIAILGAFAMIGLNGIIRINFVNAVLLSMQYGLLTPLIVLVVSTFAHNKIEGMALFKGIDLLLILPLLYFFLEGWWRHVFALLPSYWTFRLFENSIVNDATFGLSIWGFVIYLVTIFVLFLSFKKRVLSN